MPRKQMLQGRPIHLQDARMQQQVGDSNTGSSTGNMGQGFGTNLGKGFDSSKTN